MTYEVDIAQNIANVNDAGIDPLNFLGAFSDKNKGDTINSIPNPIPTKNLPKYNASIEVAIQKAIAPPIKQISAAMITGFLPNLSASDPEPRDEINPPRTMRLTNVYIYVSLAI